MNSKILTGLPSDIVEHNMGYSTVPLFDFNRYKAQVSGLLSNFFEEILTLRSRVDFLNLVVHKQINKGSDTDGYLQKLSSHILSKVDGLVSEFGGGMIHERADIFRREKEGYGSSPLPNDLNFELIRTYIREKLGLVMEDLTRYFYHAPNGPYDTAMASLARKIANLDEFFANLNETNVLGKINIHLVELLNFIFSGENRGDLSSRIPSLLCLNMKHIFENVVERGGNEWMNSNVTTRNTFVNKDNLIDRLTKLFQEKPLSNHLNIDSVFCLKLLREKINLRNQLNDHIQKAL